MPELHEMTAVEINRELRSRAVSAVEIVKAFCDRITTTDDRLHAFLSVSRDMALGFAAALDERVAAGDEMGPLAGIPVAIKDVLCTQGVLTTCGSKILKGFTPPYDATVLARLKAAGAILI